MLNFKNNTLPYYPEINPEKWVFWVINPEKCKEKKKGENAVFPSKHAAKYLSCVSRYKI